MVAAARLSDRITLQVKTVTKTASGDVTESWGTLATVWAERRDARGTEDYLGQALLAQVDAVFLIRAIEGVTPAGRLVHGSTVFDIVRVSRVGNKLRFLELFAKTGVRDAR